MPDSRPGSSDALPKEGTVAEGDGLLTDEEILAVRMMAIRQESGASANTLTLLDRERAIALAQRDKLIRLGWQPNHS